MQTVGVKSPEKVTKNVVETLKYFLSLAIFFEKQNYGISELDYSINALCYQHIDSKDKLNIRKSLVSNYHYLPDL
jgi:hypothetical protein